MIYNLISQCVGIYTRNSCGTPTAMMVIIYNKKNKRKKCTAEKAIIATIWGKKKIL